MKKLIKTMAMIATFAMMFGTVACSSGGSDDNDVARASIEESTSTSSTANSDTETSMAEEETITLESSTCVSESNVTISGGDYSGSDWTVTLDSTNKTVTLSKVVEGTGTLTITYSYTLNEDNTLTLAWVGGTGPYGSDTSIGFVGTWSYSIDSDGNVTLTPGNDVTYSNSITLKISWSNENDSAWNLRQTTGKIDKEIITMNEKIAKRAKSEKSDASE